MTVTIRNKDRLLAKLKAMAPAAEKALADANRKTAEEMAATARRFSQSDRVRGSIRVEPGPNSASLVVKAGGVAQTMVNTGRYPFDLALGEEFGTAPHIVGGMFAGSQHPGTQRRPYFWPAYRLIRKAMRGRASRALNKAIKGVARR
jgi:hypothetical protein